MNYRNKHKQMMGLLIKHAGFNDPEKKRALSKSCEEVFWDGPLRKVRRNLTKVILEREPSIDVDDLLRRMGVEDEDRVNFCIKAAILNGHIQVQGDPSELHKVFWTFPCPEGCRKEIKVSLLQALKQKEIGDSWGDKGYAASCESCGCGYFLSEVCKGKPTLQDGKYHNHCHECPNFGICYHDYRMAHCEFCLLHYPQGNYGYPCNSCGRRYTGEYANDEERGSGNRQEKLDEVLLAEDYESPKYQAMFDALGPDKEEGDDDEEDSDDE